MKMDVTEKVQDMCTEITVTCNFTEDEDKNIEINMYATTYFDGVFFGTVERVFHNEVVGSGDPRKEELLFWDEWEADSLEEFILFMKEQYDEYMRIGKEQYLKLHS